MKKKQKLKQIREMKKLEVQKDLNDKLQMNKTHTKYLGHSMENK